MTMVDRPEYVESDMLTFLDDLRESGACNMFGATQELMYDWPDLTKRERRGVLGYWMRTFEKRHGGRI